MTGRCDIAVIGAACRLPGARNLDEFADLLFAGRDAVREIPEDRFTKSRFFFPEAGQPGKTYSFAAGFIDQVDGFDAGFFGVSPREAVSIDPQQRLMLELAFDAVCDAGHTLSGLAGSRTGVYIGGSSWDFAAKSFADAAALDAYSMQGAALSSLSNRVSYLFDLRGPSFTVDTACSSSLVALHLACSAIRRGETDMALVGGVNLLLAPQSFVGFSRASMLSKTGRCHPFDSRADGYVRAEGGGAVLLKPLDRALADGDDIRAVIRATGVNSDGRTNGFSLPSRAAQAALLREIYDQAAIDPDDLVYFEAHGTGTPVGDPIEAYAIGEALARRRRNALPIGSVKSNIGHLEPASGMAGLLKLILSFEHHCVPRSLNFAKPNPHIPFASLNLQVVGAPLQLPENFAEGPCLAGLNSFGFGGTNAHAVVAPPPPTSLREKAALLPPLLLSARSEAALAALVATWRDRLLDAPVVESPLVELPLVELSGVRMPALLRGAAQKRDLFAHRLMVEAATPADMGQELDLYLGGERPAAVAAGQAVAGDLVFVYSGNGSQWAGMCRDGLAHSSVFRAAMAGLDLIMAPMLGWSLLDRLDSEDLAEALHHTEVAQPLLFAVQVAIVQSLRARGIKPSAHIGHSVGEVAAAWGSGALSLVDACRVIVARSAAQQLVHGTGSMAALGLDEIEAAAVIEAQGLDLVVAAINGSASVTVAGKDDSIEALRLLARAQKWVFVRLDLAYGFHSPCMDPIEAPLLAALEGLKSGPATEPMISTVTGDKIADGELDARYWWRNVREPVHFRDAVAGLIEDGARIFVEIGSAPVLQSLLRDGFDRAGVQGKVLASLSRRVATRDPFANLAAQLFVAGVDLRQAGCFLGEATARGLPLYPWQRQDFAAQPTIERVELASPTRDHPLLGFREPSADIGGVLAWMSHLSTVTEPWLADHRLDGVPLLPAAAMIDMMLAAARVRYPLAEGLEIQDLEISRSLLLDAGNVRDCRVRLLEDGEISIASRPRLAREDLAIHATGRVLAGFSHQPVLPTEDNEGNGLELIEAERVYELAAMLKLEYGPEFQTVSSVRRIARDRLSAQLRPHSLLRAAEGYLLDPALLDGALQALVVFAADEPHLVQHGSVVPWRFGRVRLLHTDAKPPESVDLSIRHVGPRSVCADITLRDSAGQAVAELIECWFVAMPTGRAVPRIDRFFTEYQPSLKQIAVPTPMPAAIPAGAWPQSALLADAYLAAASHAALAADPALHATPLGSVALGWLVEEQFAEIGADGALLVAETDLPAADVIWRSLFFDAPEAVAETTLLASFGTALASGRWPSLSPVLRRQFLYASSSAQAATAALAARMAGGQRIAVTGHCNARMLRAILAGNPAALVVALAADAETLAEWQDLLRAEPRLQARLATDDQASLAESFDLVAGFYALSLGADPAALAALLAPGGRISLVEPAESRAARLLFGAASPDARLHSGEDWAATLAALGAALGLAEAQAQTVGGVIWPVCLIEATSVVAAVAAPLPHLVLFAAPDDPIALAWAEREAGLSVRAPASFAAELAHLAPGGEAELMLIQPHPERFDAAWFAALLGELAGLSAIGEASLRRLWLVLRAPAQGDLLAAGLAGARRVIANELPWLDLRLVGLDPTLSAAEQLAALAQETAAPDQERESFWTHAGRSVPRLRVQSPLLPKSIGPRRLEVLQPGLISSLAWLDADSTPRAPRAGEVAIEVRAVALNFRDVMWAQGLLPDEALLEGFSGPSLGLECAGIVSAVGEGVDDLAPGDKVIAVTPAALATHAITNRTGVIRLPAGMDYAAAATIPVAFMTAAYALGHLAQLAPGEIVLIHGGAGGVGLAAIQYALDRGAIVFATAGSELRRQMLLRLGVAQVFDSRSAGFADAVWAVTNGQGVDVVLNSLSDELMLQSVRLLKPFGRFLEIGKRDLYRNTRVGIRSLRHNASYFAIDSDELVAHRPHIGIGVLREIEAMLEFGRLRPLPYRSFGFGEAVEAFRLLQSSGHVGKIVLLPEPTESLAPARFAADPEGVYVITGGLSGFGLAAAHWLEQQGATKFALLSRQGPAMEGAAEVLAGFAGEARAYACDVADDQALDAVLAQARAMGPIKGVLHAAMVLDDAHLADLTAERFARVIRPKLDGALALDRATADDDLDLFVLFSSVTTVIGTPGQANYVAANAALEALAERRHALGKPALAVQWGPIADAGYLTRETRVGEMLEKVLGAAPLGSREALAALPSLLACGRAVVGLSDAAWGDLRQRLPGLAGPFWADMPAGRSRHAGGPTVSAQIVGLSDEEALPLVLDMLIEEVGAILKLEAKSIDINRPVQEFGVDSLMAVELRTALEIRLGVGLPLLALSDATSLRAMALKLLQALRGGAGDHDDLAHAVARHEGDAANVAAE